MKTNIYLNKMSLTNLVKGFQTGWKYFSKENQDKSSVTFKDEAVVFDGPMEDSIMQLLNEGSKFEKAGFYTAMVVRHPGAVYEDFKREYFSK